MRNPKKPRVPTFLVLSTVLALLLTSLSPLLALAAKPSPASHLELRSAPPDLTRYSAPATAAPRSAARATAVLGTATPSGASAATLIRDVIMSNTDPTLATSWSGGSEPSIAVNPANPSQIVITSFRSGWGTNAALFYSTDGGQTWTQEMSIPAPPGQTGVTGCPCDQTVDFGRDGRLYGTFLLYDGTNTNVVTGSTTDPTSAAAWGWNGNPAQLTNTARANAADQPWLIVGRDPTNATQDNVYVGYDDFSGSPDARVSVSYGAVPVNVTLDSKAGTESPLVTNPGLRLATDPRNGAVYAIYEQSTGANQPVSVTYKLNRSTDGGVTWTLNGGADGLTVDTVNSDQAPNYKFGTVNALLGGVDHVAVDPANGDVYVVYGDDTAGTGVGNQLLVRRLQDNGAGGLSIGTAATLTSAASAALPSIAVASDGTVGVLYDTYDGLSSDSLPTFSAHLSLSTDHGATFTDQVLQTFYSPATDDGNARQRVLGDFQQIKASGPYFYGVFSGNRSGFGSTTSTIDPVFFSTAMKPSTLTYTGDTSADYHDSARLAATLTDDAASPPAPIAGASVAFQLGSGTTAQTCTGTTDGSGVAACTITVNQVPGSYTVSATFAGDTLYLSSSATQAFTVNREQTTLTYTGDTVIANGGPANLKASLLEDGSTPPNPSGQTVVFSLGTGSGAQTCTGTTDASGTASCTIGVVNQPLGPGQVSASFAGDTYYLPSSASASTLTFAFLSKGAFVVGDGSDTGSVTFWSDEWWQLNSLSGGVAPLSFKGFAGNTSTPPACGKAWTTAPGNSPPPAGSLPSYMGVIVSSSVAKSSSTISGDTVEIVVVKTDPGYSPNPGHPGTGTVVGVYCKQ